MKNDYSKFVAEAADRIRELAERAPDIGVELRRFADDLDRLVDILEGRSDEAAA